LDFIKNAIEIDDYSRTKLIDEMKALTNLENPNSVQQLKGWLSDNGLETESLGKKIVSELLETATGDLSKVLTLRQHVSKSSVKKYQTMENAIGTDRSAKGRYKRYISKRTVRLAERNL